MPDHLLRAYSLAPTHSQEEGNWLPSGMPSSESNDLLWPTLLESPMHYTLPCTEHPPLIEELTPSQPVYVEPTMIGAMYPTSTPSYPHYDSPSSSHPPSQDASYSPVFNYEPPVHEIAQPAITVSESPPVKGLPRCALPGTLDPITGIFYKNPEQKRLRTAQACEKCRIRKAKCSGDHPTCQRCSIRGLTCYYASEGRVRGLNKPNVKEDTNSDSPSSTNARISGSPAAQTAQPSFRSNMSTLRVHHYTHSESDVSQTARNATTKTVTTSASPRTARRRLIEVDTSFTNMRLSASTHETLTQAEVRYGPHGSGAESSGTTQRASMTPSTPSSTSPVVTRSSSVGLPTTPDTLDSPFELTPSSPQQRYHHDAFLFGTNSNTVGINGNFAYASLGGTDDDLQPSMLNEYFQWRETKEEVHDGHFFF